MQKQKQKTKRKEQRVTLSLPYTFQATVHTLWRERNNRKHGEPPRDKVLLTSFIDKLIRNRMASLRGSRNEKFDNYSQKWFSTR